MELRSKNNQEIVKSQVVSLVISFIFFNVILKDVEWLIISVVILLIVLTIVTKIWGEKISAEENNRKKYSRRTT